MTMSADRPWGRGLLLVCLAVGVTVVGALAFQAVSAARAERATVEAVLRDYAGLAAELYGNSTALALDYNWLFPAVRQLRGTPGHPEAPAPDTIIRTQVGERRLGDLVRAYFAFEVDTRTIAFPDAWPPTTLTPDLADELVEQGTAGSWPVAIRFELGGEHPRMLAYALVEAADGVRDLVGFEPPSDAFRRVLDPALQVSRIMPRSLVGDDVDNEFVSVRISTPDGAVLFRAGQTFDETYSATVDLGPRLGNLQVAVAIPAASASRLVIGGLPYSRLPAVVAMVVVTVLSGFAGAVLLRREREFVRARERFVAGASHELRTPLAQIRMFTETLRLDRVRTDDERRRSLEILDREARRLSYLVENLLRFSRTREAAIHAALTPLPLSPFIDDLIDTFAPLAATRGATVRCAGADELEVIADRDLLTQVVMNLLDNASKFGPAGQTISIRIAQFDDNTVALRVDDQGPGIPAALRSRIWERFWRGPAAGETTGTGIGLALVRELVELQRGSISIHDGPGGGARFELHLPRSRR